MRNLPILEINPGLPLPDSETAIALTSLPGLSVSGVSPAELAVLLELQTIGGVLLVLSCPVVALLALIALKGDSFSHPENLPAT